MSVLFNGQFTPLGFEAVTLASGSVESLVVPSRAKMALIQAVGKAVQWRDDGEAPTAAVGGGMYMPINAEPVGFIGNINTAEFVTTDPAGSTLLVSYYG